MCHGNTLGDTGGCAPCVWYARFQASVSFLSAICSPVYIDLKGGVGFGFPPTLFVLLAAFGMMRLFLWCLLDFFFSPLSLTWLPSLSDPDAAEADAPESSELVLLLLDGFFLFFLSPLSLT